MAPVVFVGTPLVEGVGSEVQFKGLPDGAKRCLNRANSDLMSSSCMPFTDKAGKTSQDCNLFSVFNSLEKGVQVRVVAADEVGPVSPMSNPDFLSLSNDPVGRVSLRKIVQTSELSLLCRRSKSHEAPCWRGKSELNLVRNWESERS